MTKARAGKGTQGPLDTDDTEPVRGWTADQVEQDYTTLDCLAYYVARHLEDGASDDRATRRRYGRLVGLLAEHAEDSCSRLLEYMAATRRVGLS